ncbi:hypothetical protein ACP70R_008502 [Stipagrostis hirtigluma subsp. patula]
MALLEIPQVVLFGTQRNDIVWHGYFAVPEAAKTGNQEIDEINLELAQAYTSVTRLLREKHNSAPFAAYLNIMEEDEDIARFKKCLQCQDNVL